MPDLNSGKKHSICDLLEIMGMLRDEDKGCPWDIQQTFQSIVPHTIEEVYEVVEAIEQKDYAHLPNELGDLLFQVIFYSQVGKEQGLFEFEDVVQEICEKLLTRHPHVFPNATMESCGRDHEISPAEVERNWEAIKLQEKGKKSETDKRALADIPLSLPALDRAVKIQKKAAKTGFDWSEAIQVFEKLKEECGELETAVALNKSEDINEDINEEFGDLLFTLVNLGRKLGLRPESSLRQANRKFIRRFQAMEQLIGHDNEAINDLPLEKLEEYWQAVKQSEA